MTRRSSVLLAFPVFLALGLLLAAQAEGPVSAAVETITAAELKSALYFLASDEMQGRDTASQTNEIAGAYLAHRFELMGLEHPPDRPDYFQSFYLSRSSLQGTSQLSFEKKGSPLSTVAVLYDDFYPSSLSASARVTAPVVFAGFGITAPDLQYDDYRGVDAEGKIVLVMTDEPGAEDPNSRFDGVVSSDYGREQHKVINAQQHGAVGVILVESDEQSPGSFGRGARRAWLEGTSSPRFSLEIWASQVQIPVLYLSQSTADSLLSSQKLSIKDLRKKIDNSYASASTELRGVVATAETSLSKETIPIRNVIAYLPGTDPELKNEVVIVSAHYDHVGTRDGEVFNGADDDGSGTVGLLEIAQAFALNKQRPKRSVLFAAWNAEERGLLGAYYYADRPLLPLAKTVAVFQMDMIGRNEEVPAADDRRFRGLEKQSAEQNANSVNVLGYSRSTDMKDLVSKANGTIGLDLKFRYDNQVLGLLRRSDNWPFLIKGIPSVFFHTGLHPDYHTPADTPNKINYPKMEKIVRLVFLSAWQAANTSKPPVLNSRDIS